RRPNRRGAGRPPGPRNLAARTRLGPRAIGRAHRACDQNAVALRSNRVHTVHHIHFRRTKETPHVAKKRRKTGIGVIGTGGIAKAAHLPGYAAVADLCDVVAVCDIDKDVLRQAAEQFNVKETYTDYNKMLEMDEVDAISVCTPNYVHMEPALRALKAGKHVL